MISRRGLEKSVLNRDTAVPCIVLTIYILTIYIYIYVFSYSRNYRAILDDILALDPAI